MNDPEWDAIRIRHFPDITDPITLSNLHTAYLFGYEAGIIWMRETYTAILHKSAVPTANT